ncbi:hypothetical protein [Gluconacetobacter tumulicola]|uniref:Uncharacterized protein n=1 Tax=Gluconacetobacter tumulicola TaxID=1017177 RepID=A0A7W4JCM6_9PROT|nr:hypothetical protein [Gluconacetobacter tumulicola]MBB2178809.1 hypothetical protein [Gluconacetobacter tumulicola]
MRQTSTPHMVDSSTLHASGALSARWADARGGRYGRLATPASYDAGDANDHPLDRKSVISLFWRAP